MACIKHNSPVSTVVNPPAHYPSAALSTLYPFAYNQHSSLPSINSYTQSPVTLQGESYPSEPSSFNAKDSSFSNAFDSNYETISASSMPAVSVVPSCIGAQEVAHSFVFQYYSMLHREPQNLHLFYDEDSNWSCLSEGHASSSPVWLKAFGQCEIYEAFEKSLVKNATSQIHCIAAQDSNDGSILLLVTGSLTNINQLPREFIQSVYLAKQKSNRKGWYIKNEIFIFVNSTSPQINETIERNISDENVEVTENDTANIPLQVTEIGPAAEQISKDQKIHETYENEVEDLIEEAQQSFEDIVHQPKSTTEKSMEEIPNTFEIRLNKEVENKESNLKVLNSDEKIVSQAKAHTTSKHWGETAPVLSNTSDPSWPKLSESIRHKNASVKTETEDLHSHYDSASFASKLMRNVNTKGTFQRGYAVQVKKDEKAHENTGKSDLLDSVDTINEKFQNGSNDKNERNTVSRKRIWVAEFPKEFTNEVIKRSVASQLKNFNDGHVVEIARPYIELDCRQSVEYLVKHGWWLNGRQMRIDYANSRTNRGTEQEPRNRSSYANSYSCNNNKSSYRGMRNSRNEDLKHSEFGKFSRHVTGSTHNLSGKEFSTSPTTATSSGTNNRDNAAAVAGNASTTESKSDHRNNVMNRARHGAERVFRTNNGNRKNNWSDSSSLKRKTRVNSGSWTNVDGNN